jgi:hypothetical protein
MPGAALMRSVWRMLSVSIRLNLGETKMAKRKQREQINENRPCWDLDTDECARLLRQRLAYTNGAQFIDASMALDLISILAGQIRQEQYNGKDNFSMKVTGPKQLENDTLLRVYNDAEAELQRRGLMG